VDFGGVENRLLVKLLSASALRARVIANNISNQNVPGFKRQLVRFEELAGGRPADLVGMEPRIETDLVSPASPDGNNVSLEVENNAMRENRLMYELYASILQGRMELVRAAITEGR
jgi:flagellar basal body rod protein FlgB